MLMGNVNGDNVNGNYQTSNGIELDYKVLKTHELETKILGRKKYTPDQVEIMRNMSHNLSKKMVCNQLENNHILCNIE